MDQGNHGAHHQSKEPAPGQGPAVATLAAETRRTCDGRPVVDLPGATAPGGSSGASAFARKTYRFYKGGEVSRGRHPAAARQPAASAPAARAGPADLTLRRDSARSCGTSGQHLSDGAAARPSTPTPRPARCTPRRCTWKRVGSAGSCPGMYYYHPVQHRLMLIGQALPDAARRTPHAKVHFVGKTAAPSNRSTSNNIREVLEIEAGPHGRPVRGDPAGLRLDIVAGRVRPSIKDQLDCAAEDHYLGTFEVAPDHAECRA